MCWIGELKAKEKTGIVLSFSWSIICWQGCDKIEWNLASNHGTMPC